MQHEQSSRSIVDPTNQPIVRLKQRSIILPDRRRVAIDLRLNATDGQFAMALQPGDLPFRENDSDVILMTRNYYLFENRWRDSNELIDYRVVQFWDVARIDLNFQSLRRIKIYFGSELSARSQIDLLVILGSCTRVEQLEIDALELIDNSENDLEFKFLRLLSIDAIRVVNKYGQEAPEDTAIIQLRAVKLQTFYSGGYLD